MTIILQNLSRVNVRMEDGCDMDYFKVTSNIMHLLFFLVCCVSY